MVKKSEVETQVWRYKTSVPCNNATSWLMTLISSSSEDLKCTLFYIYVTA